MDAFYEPLGDGRYRSTGHTRGPWDPGAQHAGPPAALLGGLLDATTDGRITRITLEILRPVPIADLSTSVETVRPGRNVSLREATLSADDGPVMMARAWSVRAHPTGADPIRHHDPLTPTPSDSEKKPFFAVQTDEGWHTAMDIRFAKGGFAEPGPATVWMRATVAVVAGEQIRPIERALLAADAGNGVSSELDWTEWLFINTELTVHLHRYPEGEWVGMDATTTIEADGIGFAASVLHDAAGPIGRGAQALVVRPARRD